jgi:hypothetical protein
MDLDNISPPKVKPVILANGKNKAIMKYNICAGSLFCPGCFATDYTGLYISSRGMYDVSKVDKEKEHLIHNKDRYNYEDNKLDSKRYYEIRYILPTNIINEEDSSIIPHQHNIHLKRVLKFSELEYLFSNSKIRCLVYLVDKEQRRVVYTRNFSGYISKEVINPISSLKYPNCDGSLYCKGCKTKDFPDDGLIYNKDVITQRGVIDEKLPIYWLIYSLYDNGISEDKSIIPKDHNIIVEQCKTFDEVEEETSNYACGGCYYTVYSVNNGVKTQIDVE